jgi:hypothetical protein
LSQAARGIDNQHVDALGRRLFDAVEHDPGRVAAFLAGDHRSIDALAPDPELLDRGGAERIAGGEQHAIILFLQPMPELADRRRLARAIDADDEDHVGPRKTPHLQRLGDRCEDLFYLFGENRAEAAFVEALEPLLRDRLADPARSLRAKVGGNQRLLDVVERSGIESSPAGETGQVVGDPIGGFLEAAAQAVEPAHAHTAVS